MTFHLIRNSSKTMLFYSIGPVKSLWRVLRFLIMEATRIYKMQDSSILSKTAKTTNHAHYRKISLTGTLSCHQQPETLSRLFWLNLNNWDSWSMRSMKTTMMPKLMKYCSFFSLSLRTNSKILKNSRLTTAKRLSPWCLDFGEIKIKKQLKKDVGNLFQILTMKLLESFPQLKSIKFPQIWFVQELWNISPAKNLRSSLTIVQNSQLSSPLLQRIYSFHWAA